MIKCRLLLYCPYCMNNVKDYFLECDLPALPTKGMFLDVDWSPLEHQIKSNLEIAKCFHPYWCHGDAFNKDKEDLTFEDLKDFCFDEACFVHHVYMKQNCDFVVVVLYNGDDV